MSDKRELTEALEAAQTAPAILEALARAAWHNDHDGADCPDDRIPTVAALARWWPERCPEWWPERLPDDTAQEYKDCALALCQAANERYGEGPDPMDLGIAAHRTGTPASEISYTAFSVLWSIHYPRETKPADDRNEGCGYLVRDVSEGDGWADATEHVGKLLSDVHTLWRLLGHEGVQKDHPLAPIVRAWQERPREVEADEKANAIMPAPFAIVRDLRSEQGQLFSNLPVLARPGLAAPDQPDLFGSLPGFEPPGSAIVPSLPLVLFDAADGMSTGKGRGAPLALRVWIECVLRAQPDDRARAARLTVKLRDFIAALWPNDTYRPSRDGPKLVRALNRIHVTRVPWTDPEGKPMGYWAAVIVRNMPVLSNKSSPVVFDVSLPPGAEVGPMVHRPTLRQYGVTSAPAYRATLGLAYLWNRHLTHKGKRLSSTVPVVRRDDAGHLIGAGGNVLTAKGGVPVKHWSDRRAIRTGEDMRNPELARLPWLDPAHLIALGFPEATLPTKQARSQALKRIRAALRTMADNGDLVIAEDGPRWRLEPPDWWGDPKARDRATG